MKLRQSQFGMLAACILVVVIGVVLASMLPASIAGTTPVAAAQAEPPPGAPASHGLFMSKGAHTGPAIERYGPVFAVENPDFGVLENRPQKVVFELLIMEDTSGEYNAWVDSIARFVNMNVEAGVSLDNLDVAVVIHGAATPILLDNGAYRERFGVDNPNIPLFQALTDAGVRLYGCAQAMAIFDVPRDRAAPQIQVALSAMNAVVALQAEGYHLLTY